jgi:hypothetical protein
VLTVPVTVVVIDVAEPMSALLSARASPPASAAKAQAASRQRASERDMRSRRSRMDALEKFLCARDYSIVVRASNLARAT